MLFSCGAYHVCWAVILTFKQTWAKAGVSRSQSRSLQNFRSRSQSLDSCQFRSRSLGYEAEAKLFVQYFNVTLHCYIEALVNHKAEAEAFENHEAEARLSKI